MRSKLPAGDFSSAPLVNVSKHTLYLWKQRFEAEGSRRALGQTAAPRQGAACRTSPSAGDPDDEAAAPRLGRGSDLGPAAAHPGAAGSPLSAIATVLTEDGYLVEESRACSCHLRTRSGSSSGRSSNQMWQDWICSRSRSSGRIQRVVLVGFMDDHSRYIVSYGLHASQSAARWCWRPCAAPASRTLPWRRAQ